MRVLLLLSLLAPCLALPAAAQPARFAVVVGNNLGRDANKVLRYAESDARKMSDVLQQIGGFAPANTLLLLGQSAERVWQALRQLEQRMRAAKQSSADGILLVFYYAGHAEGDVLELGQTMLRYDQLAHFLRSSAATVRLGLVDSCQSGKLVATRGARRAPAFTVKLSDKLDSTGYAMITSSAADELSQESAEVRGSFFTHYLVSALRGAADASGDGKVTLSEAYRYTYARTVARTNAHVGGGQHPMYAFRLSGKGEVVLTQTRKTSARLEVHNSTSGRLVVLDGTRKSMLAEAALVPQAHARLALPPGEVEVYLIGEGTALRARTRLAAGKLTRLDQRRDFERYVLRQAVTRGGLFRPIWTSRLGVAGLLRRWPLGESQSLSYGTSVTYWLMAPAGWQATLRLLLTTAADEGASEGFISAGALAGGGYGWRLAFVRLHAEALIGYEHLFQSAIAGQDRHSPSFVYLGSLGASLPIGRRFAAHLDGGVGGRAFRLREDSVAHALDLQLSLGISWGWTH